MMDLLVELAATGRIGPVHAGMSLAEAHELFGPGRPHPALRMRPDLDGYPYTWGSLELEKAGEEVAKVGLRLWPGQRLELPAGLEPAGLEPAGLGPAGLGPAGRGADDGASATVERQAFLGALDDAGCPYQTYSPLTFGDQSAIRTEVGTTAAFGHFAASEKVAEGYYLIAIYHRG
jgi:hypothetical protein